MTHSLDLSLIFMVRSEAAARLEANMEKLSVTCAEIVAASSPSTGQEAGRRAGWFVTVNFQTEGRLGPPSGPVRGQQSSPGQLFS